MPPQMNIDMNLFQELYKVDENEDEKYRKNK